MLDNNDIYVIKKLLLPFYSDDSKERVGFIKPNNVLVEVENSSNDPFNSFLLSAETILEHAIDGAALATWHTHPQADANLSAMDYKTFMNWPEMYHFIVGKDGIKVYKYNESKKAILEI